MAALRDIKRKIEAVRKTSQITKAMNMVAASKLRGAQQNMEKFHPYALKFREFIGRLASGWRIPPNTRCSLPERK